MSLKALNVGLVTTVNVNVFSLQFENEYCRRREQIHAQFDEFKRQYHSMIVSLDEQVAVHRAKGDQRINELIQCINESNDETARLEANMMNFTKGLEAFLTELPK